MENKSSFTRLSIVTTRSAVSTFEFCSHSPNTTNGAQLLEL